MPKKAASARNVPLDPDLYAEAKRRVKARVKVWPSAYASGQLVQEYKRLGGRYRSTGGKAATAAKKNGKRSRSNKRVEGGLTRWFEERWVNVCEPKTSAGKYKACGRKRATAQAKDYPYCRPSVRVSSQTPKTVGEMTPAELQRMCRKKRSTPQARGGKPTRNPTAKRSTKKSSARKRAQYES